eukprot:498818-Rhodomonas_salina.2
MPYYSAILLHECYALSGTVVPLSAMRFPLSLLVLGFISGLRFLLVVLCRKLAHSGSKEEEGEGEGTGEGGEG